MTRFLFTVILLLGATVAGAHDVQPARAAVEFENGRYKLTLSWDLAAAITGVSAGHIPPEDIERIQKMPEAELQALIDQHHDVLLDHTRAIFDGESLEAEEIVMPDTAEVRRAAAAVGPLGLVVGVLRGEVPEKAGTMALCFPPQIGPVVLSMSKPPAPTIHQILSDGQTSWPLLLKSEAAGTVQYNPWIVGTATAVQYIVVGFEHILPAGIDHVLFVLGLFLLSARLKPLLWQVTAFTLAHTVTLALAMLEIVRVPAGIVEPLIAASIAYVAIENLFTNHLTPWRPAIVFGFGLLHGLGFAGALTEWGLPENQFVTALVAFNVGVELGQLAVIAIAFLLVGWWRNRPWYRRWIVIPASCAIAIVALYWTVTRILEQV